MSITFLLACALAPASTLFPESVSLDGSWRLTQPQRHLAISARVPGVVQTDLMRAGIIPDPYFRENANSVQWVSDLPWVYSKSIAVSPEFLRHRRIILRFEGLDTLATVRLNGRDVARANNMFRTLEFDAKPFLKPGSNSIEVAFQTLDDFMKSNVDRPKRFGKPIQDGGKQFIRKAPFQGGWDFAPKLLTTGIWRSVRLVGWDAARLTGIEVTQDHRPVGQVDLDVRIEAETTGPAKADVSLLFKGRKVASSSAILQGGKGSTKIAVRNPQLWWPNEMGPQNLYDVRVEVRRPNGTIVDRGARRIGLRTVRWIPKTDKTPLALEVNGRRFFAKGSNWVPLDSLLRQDPAKERGLVQKAVDAHMNLMRLWGGGYYESDSFFDACDEKGLLVWFEFKFADAPYPSFDPEWLANVKAEAEDNVRRVRHHPCIAVYSGNNEVVGFIRDTTTESAMSRDEYDLLFHRLLRDVVHDLAPDAAYTPGSPEIGDDHYWDVWHGSSPFESYRTRHGFMSEFGFQAFPSPRTVEEFTDPSDRTSVETPAMLAHQKNWRDGNALIVSSTLRNFRKPKDFESTLWLGQINQADGIATGIEHWRRDWPNSTASLVWQFNDPWPVTSWSMVDSSGRPKALYFRLRHVYAPIALSGIADPETGLVDLWVVNDRPQAKSGKLEWTLMRPDGKTVERGHEGVPIRPGTSSGLALHLDVSSALKREGESSLLLWATLHTQGEPESRTLLTFARPKELELQDPGIVAKVEPRGDRYRVVLTVRRPALDAWIEFEGMDADLSDNFVPLQPGTPVVIDVSPHGKRSLADLRRSLRVRSLFDTYLPGTPAHGIVRPGLDGQVVATADDADILGDGPVLEAGVPNNLGNWRSANNAIRWTVQGIRPGSYRVSVLVSAPPPDSGGTFDVEAAGTRLHGAVPTTKSWTDYVSLELGRVVVEHGGTTTILLRPVDKPMANLMNLRSLTLTPVNP